MVEWIPYYGASTRVQLLVGYILSGQCSCGLCSLASRGRMAEVVRAETLIQCPGGAVHDE